MSKAELNNEKEQIISGNDDVVIQKYISGIKGGRTLDMEGFTDKMVKAGHVIITKDGVYKPMPVTPATAAVGDSPATPAGYGTLPTGYSYAGVLYRTIPASKPFASIMTWGEVNSECIPYPMTSILTAFKAACPHIDFIKDEEA